MNYVQGTLAKQCLSLYVCAHPHACVHVSECVCVCTLYRCVCVCARTCMCTPLIQCICMNKLMVPEACEILQMVSRNFVEGCAQAK